MADDPRQREWREEAPHYDDPDRFTVELDHNGFLCGLKEHLQYVGGTVDYFDNCNTDTFSLLWLEDFVKQGGNEITEKTKFYWCVPGSDMRDGLCLVENDGDIVAMMAAVRDVKTLSILVAHNNFLQGLRTDVFVPDVLVPIPSKYTGAGDGAEQEKEIDEEPASSACLSSGELHSEDEDDGDTDSDFYDSDYDAEDGDDDLFLDNIDKDVNDNNECTYIVECEDDAGLDHDNLKLTNEQQKLLEYKFKEFNPEVDMATPVFKVGMLFSSMAEFRKALTAYGVNERVKIRKSRNEATRLDAHCEEGCPWMIKVSEEKREGAIVVRQHCSEHTCERYWELKSLTAPFLTQIFIDEFRDNQKLGLQAFAAKVQRKFNMCPNRFKLGRARKAALNIIHGDEKEQFALLCDYGQELRRSNPGSRFFLSTNQIKEAADDVPKEHLATLYWSYDACKRGFLEGCRPLICIDGCHIKTRYKGNLLTAVGIDPNDCIYPIAMGLVEFECTSSWEWFLTTLRDDLGITNTCPFTIMSDRQKAAAHFPIPRVQQPLPEESAFVVLQEKNCHLQG
ncbi:hypothetical protein ACQ4PT_044516 [Festuca glaucescens]